MTEEQFLNSSPRQIKTLLKFHRNFSKSILVEIINDFMSAQSKEETEEIIEIESLADI